MKETGVAQKAVIFNKDRKLLTIFRTETAPSRPNTWDLPGGDLDFGEDPLESVIREIKEETGLDVSGVEPFDVEAHINKEGNFWVTIAYRAQAVSDEVVLSFEHNDYKWVASEEFLKLKSAAKLTRFVENL